jgi:hypothetical protein
MHRVGLRSADGAASPAATGTPRPAAARAALAVALALAGGCTAPGDQDMEGRLQHLVVDRQDQLESRDLFMLQTAEGEVELVFDRLPGQLATGDRLRAQGRLLPPPAQPIHDRPTLLVNDFQLLEPAASQSPSSQQALIIDPARAPTPRKLAVVLFNFKNDDRQPMTREQVQRQIFLDAYSAREFYKEQSYGLLQLSGKTGPQGEVFGWYSIDAINRPCSYAAWGEMALAAARNAGADLTGYDNTVFFFPASDACPFLGVGQQPGNNTWMNGMSIATFIHELGHNIGTPHAAARTCTGPDGKRVTLGDSCRDAEYGNPFDVMGAGFRHTHAYNKAQARWLSSSNIGIVDKDGVYTVLAQERPSDGVQVLRVPRDPSTFYYLEYRQPFGFDNFAVGSPAVSGLIVVIGTELRGLARSFLLDMSPETTTLGDAPLAVGKTFEDSKNGVKIKLLSVTPESAQVDIVVGPPTGVR